jgi:hypothetical protein
VIRGGIVISTLALTLCAGVLGFVLGRNWQQVDESTVITRVAAIYVEQTGGDARDCVGIPGRGAVWVRVTCGGRIYLVDRRGRVTEADGPEA